jgi:hypothetical protein
MIWDVSTPRHPRWRNEMSIAQGPWTLVEEYEMQVTVTPSGRSGKE